MLIKDWGWVVIELVRVLRAIRSDVEIYERKAGK